MSMLAGFLWVAWVGCASAWGAEGEGSGERRVIKTIQPKRHSRSGRWELSPHLAVVPNDPFITRYIAGLGLAYHPTEIFGVELGGDFSPDLGQADWKAVTEELIEGRNVSPSISRWIWSADAALMFAPIHAKAATRRRIVDMELFGRAGAAVVHTEDDPESLAAPNDPYTRATLSENHLALTVGGGFRVYMREDLSVRLEGRSLQYTEIIDGGTLQAKSYVVLLAGASFLFPPRGG